jgi:hypothetical protein
MKANYLMKILFLALIMLGCKNENHSGIINQKLSDKNEIILVNKKFIDALTNEFDEDSIKVKNAFYELKIFEPILFGILPGDINHKLTYNNERAGGDISMYDYTSTNKYYSYSLDNTQNIFNIEKPDYPKEIINQWHQLNTTYFQNRKIDNIKYDIHSLYSRINKNHDTIYVLNGDIEMININKYLNVYRLNQLNSIHKFYFDILNSLSLKYANDSILNFYQQGISEFWDHDKGIYENKTRQNLIEYGICLNNSGQLPFKTKHLAYAEVKLFPRYQTRSALNIKSIDGIYGINQFFMDHDLTSGFVHPFTTNFFEKLPDNGYVLVFDRSLYRINQGRIYYKLKSDLSQPSDVLGQNIAFCRQWKLSEIDINGYYIMMKKSKYSSNSYCPQLKKESSNPYYPEIPIWSSYNQEGYVDYRRLNSLTDYDGGTVVIIWTYNNQTLFTDIHGSIFEIIEEAKRIKTIYKVDPTIGIYDAGPFARKFKSTETGIVDFNHVNILTGTSEYVGAGYGYLR